jgi:hypothetical protein
MATRQMSGMSSDMGDRMSDAARRESIDILDESFQNADEDVNFAHTDIHENTNEFFLEPDTQIFQDSEVAGGFDEQMLIGTYAELEILREKNMELEIDLEELRYKEKHTAYQRKPIVVDFRRMELVWKYLPPIQWSLKWYFGCRGLEYLFIYMIIARDVAWCFADREGSYGAALFGGIATVVVASLALLRALWVRNFGEFVFSTSRLLWAVGMFMWVEGVAYDAHFFPDETIAEDRRDVAKTILICAFILEGLRLFIIRPNNVIPWKFIEAGKSSISIPSPPYPNFMRGMTKYDEPRFQLASWYFRSPRLCNHARFFAFEYWRDYEMALLFCYIGHDLGYAADIPALWGVFTALGMVLLIYMVNISLNTRVSYVGNHVRCYCMY